LSPTEQKFAILSQKTAIKSEKLLKALVLKEKRHFFR
jgi:hypothetical protein